ncbi:MAG TPA: hypothetical protein VIK33_17470 [Anaerolineae bacterium]
METQVSNQKQAIDMLVRQKVIEEREACRLIAEEAAIAWIEQGELVKGFSARGIGIMITARYMNMTMAEVEEAIAVTAIPGDARRCGQCIPNGMIYVRQDGAHVCANCRHVHSGGQAQ